MYARTDAHYLLHIAAVLEARLLASRGGAAAVQAAAQKSQAISLSLYSKPRRDAAVTAAATAVLRKFSPGGAGGTGGQAAAESDSGAEAGINGGAVGAAVGGALRDCVYVLADWRDATARKQDAGAAVATAVSSSRAATVDAAQVVDLTGMALRK